MLCYQNLQGTLWVAKDPKLLQADSELIRLWGCMHNLTGKAVPWLRNAFEQLGIFLSFSLSFCIFSFNRVLKIFKENLIGYSKIFNLVF